MNAANQNVKSATESMPTASLWKKWRDRLFQHEDINFLLTNRIPRNTLTRFMGWFSKIERPWVRDLSIGAWKLFAHLDLSDARKQKFTSLHDCFTRQLKEGARVVDQDKDVMVSPCDAIVGAGGNVEGTVVFQAKGFPYTLQDLLGSDALAETYRDGCYVTLRLTSSMYHRFHAPLDGRVKHVTYISGDTWNVNPIALKRIERLFCKNERAVIEIEYRHQPYRITLVPVAAVLVASIRLHFLNILFHLRYRGTKKIPCQSDIERGVELGWFEHGSTIIVFAPKGFTLCDEITTGKVIRMGQRLMRIPPK